MAYCARCHKCLKTQQHQIFLNEAGEEYKNKLDWCGRCRDVVRASQYGIPPWTIGAAMLLLCFVQL
jgi:uncharacterized CHY-type Zn-finger protein